MLPRSGDVLHVGRDASVQFVVPILFRVIRLHDWDTYTGWRWIDGYELNDKGEAVERRTIWVQVNGLRAVGTAPDPRTRNAKRYRTPGVDIGDRTAAALRGPARRSTAS